MQDRKIQATHTHTHWTNTKRIWRRAPDLATVGRQAPAFFERLHGNSGRFQGSHHRVISCDDHAISQHSNPKRILCPKMAMMELPTKLWWNTPHAAWFVGWPYWWRLKVRHHTPAGILVSILERKIRSYLLFSNCTLASGPSASRAFRKSPFTCISQFHSFSQERFHALFFHEISHLQGFAESSDCSQLCIFAIMLSLPVKLMGWAL